MTRDSINVHYPALDNTESVAKVAITKQTVTQANGITIKDAFANKNNTLFIVVDSTGASQIVVKAGNAFPNAMLGDKAIAISSGISAVQIHDLARFQKTDGSIDLDFATGFVGTIYAVAKWAGVRPVA